MTVSLFVMMVPYFEMLTNSLGYCNTLLKFETSS